MKDELVLHEMICDVVFDNFRCGFIFGNRYIIVDKFVSKSGIKVIVFLDLFEGKTYIKDVEHFCEIVEDMDLHLTKDIINIDYVREDR